MALVGPNPAFFRGDDGDRLLLDHRFQRHRHSRRRLADRGPPGAQGSLRRNPFLNAGDFPGYRFPPAVLVAKQTAQAFAFLGQLGVLVPDFLFLQLAELPQAHVEDRFGLDVGQLEGLHHLLFRLVLGADDLDDLVQIQIRDQKPVEHLEAVFDLLQTMLGAPDQDFHAVIEERLKRLAQVHDPGRVVGVEHVEVQRHPGFQLGLAEQLLHQHVGADGAASGLEHDAHRVGGFVAHIGQDRQLFGDHQLGDLLDQARFLHLVGNFGDDDLIEPAPELFFRPPGAQPKTAAPGRIGLDDGAPGFDQDPAGREIGSRDQARQLGKPDVGEFDQVRQRVAQLDDVVGRDRRRHADGDARRPVGQ